VAATVADAFAVAPRVIISLVPLIFTPS